jgi:hypothetical protein
MTRPVAIGFKPADVTRISRTALVAGVALLLSAPAALAQSKEFSRTVSLESGGELILDASKGSVQLSAWNRNEVEIRARIEASNWPAFDTNYSQRAVEATTVDVDATTRSVKIRSNYDNVPVRWGWLGGSWKETPHIHYVIMAPAKVNLRLDIDRSDTELRGFDGRLTLNLDRSELKARDLGGAIELTIDRGGRSELTNIRGGIDLDADRTDVWIDAARLDRASRVYVDRSDVELRIPASQPLNVRADLQRRGTFRSDFPLTRRGRYRSEVNGTINGGGPELLVRGDRTTFQLRTR